jgi:hypothetical protein
LFFFLSIFFFSTFFLIDVAISSIKTVIYLFRGYSFTFVAMSTHTQDLFFIFIHTAHDELRVFYSTFFFLLSIWFSYLFFLWSFFLRDVAISSFTTIIYLSSFDLGGLKLKNKASICKPPTSHWILFWNRKKHVFHIFNLKIYKIILNIFILYFYLSFSNK